MNFFRTSGSGWRNGSLLFHFRFGSGSSRGSARDVEDHDQGAGRDFVTGVDLDLFNGTFERCRDFHRGFITLYDNQGLLSGNGIAHFHQDLGHFNFVTADVRHVHFFCRSSSCRCSGGRSGFFLLFLRRCSSRCTVGGIENHDQFTGLGFVADRDFDLFNNASLRRRNFHRGFITLYDDQRLLSFNFVAHVDQNLGDLYFVRADVRYIDFDSHSLFTSYARRGLTLSASMLNLVMASATTFLSMSPRLASSPSAATTT